MAQNHSMNTKEKAIKLRKENPFLSLVDIAKELKVSKQRIHKILKDASLPTSSIKPRKAVYCLVCGKSTSGRKTCNECHYTYYFLRVNCAFCHIAFYKRRSVIIHNYNYGYNNIYCSRQCYYRGLRDKEVL